MGSQRWELTRAFRDGDGVVAWQVWNLTEEERVILLVDIWHPELSLEERAAIVDMFDYARQQGWMDKKSDQGA